jgi:hypothetical protein
MQSCGTTFLPDSGQESRLLPPIVENKESRWVMQLCISQLITNPLQALSTPSASTNFLSKVARKLPAIASRDGGLFDRRPTPRRGRNSRPQESRLTRTGFFAPIIPRAQDWAFLFSILATKV